MNKTMLKLVWSLAAIVLLVGAFRLVMVSNHSSNNQNVPMHTSK